VPNGQLGLWFRRVTAQDNTIARNVRGRDTSFIVFGLECSFVVFRGRMRRLGARPTNDDKCLIS